MYLIVTSMTSNSNTCELWSKISGHGDKYEVSSLGRVRNRFRILKQGTSTHGYYQICLTHNYKKTTLKVHRLVAFAFIKPVAGKSYVNHIDGNKKNNVVSNLEWCTAKENRIHAVKNNIINHKLKPGDGVKIRGMYKNGFTQTYIADLFGVDQSMISNIVLGKSMTWDK